MKKIYGVVTNNQALIQKYLDIAQKGLLVDYTIQNERIMSMKFMSIDLKYEIKFDFSDKRRVAFQYFEY